MDVMLYAIILLILPIAELFTGLLLYKTGRGFNTPRAWKNPAVQAFAARHCGRLMLRLMPLSVIITAIAVVLMFAFSGSMDAVLSIFLATMFIPQMIFLLIPFLVTSRVLKRNFDKTGKPLADSGISEADMAAFVPTRLGRKGVIILTAVSILFAGAMTLLIVLGFATPNITIQDANLRISGMYGTTVALANIEGVTLLQQAPRDAGFGARVGGTASPNTLMGNFRNGLVFAQNAQQGPTIRIDVRDSRSIFISRSEVDDTMDVYRMITEALRR